ncbi:MAG: sigma-70 family RNA polymerase sigma factor [Gemmataceae bacterium]|nr:sigma-70 family RNA polymerase sigma factor [Gemmataceae bacterium]MCS7270168.1 sigma-70 family RNA polymerase sigma factor [Gemmataceae bacterium]
MARIGTRVSGVDEEAGWIRAAQAGDRTAFAQLVERYWERLYRWLYQLTQDRHAAEDLTQETFLKALAGLNSFRLGSNFRAWLFRIGHNNFVNRKRGERHRAGPLPEEVGWSGNTAELTAEQREWLERVQEAVARLPLDFRAALLLRVYEELSFREVARILHTTEETARWRVFKARQLLLQQLAPELLPPEAGGSSEE